MPERQSGGTSWSRNHHHTVPGDFLDLPGRCAEGDDVSDPGFVHHFLIQLPHFAWARSGAFFGKHHGVGSSVGYGASAGHGQSLSARARGDETRLFVVLQWRSEGGEILAVVGTGHHAHHSIEHGSVEIFEWRGLAHGHVPVVWFQIIHRRGGDGLLGKHVQGGAWNGQCFDVSGAHAFDACGRADDLLSCNRVEQCMRDSPDLVVGAPHPLQSRGHGQWRCDLDNQIH